MSEFLDWDPVSRVLLFDILVIRYGWVLALAAIAPRLSKIAGRWQHLPADPRRPYNFSHRSSCTLVLPEHRAQCPRKRLPNTKRSPSFFTLIDTEIRLLSTN